jgi:hypothetical protein
MYSSPRLVLAAAAREPPPQLSEPRSTDVVNIRGRTGLVALLGVGAAAALALTLLGAGSTKPKVSFRPAVVGMPPPGSVVLAQEDADLALGLALQRTPGRLLLVATVLGSSGAASGLRVSFGVGGQVAAAGDCGPGCYEATLTSNGTPRRATVDVAGAGSSGRPVTFHLPRQWPAPALALVHRTARTYRRLKTLVVHEHLASDPTHAVDTTFWKRAPDRLHFKVRGGDDTIIIGTRRWDRLPHGSWTRSGTSRLRAIEPSWTRLVKSATLLGTATMAGRPAWVVSFANPAIPAWFTVWIDKRTYRTLQVSMTATGHFMTDRYTGFDAPLSIEPPRTN